MNKGKFWGGDNLPEDIELSESYQRPRTATRAPLEKSVKLQFDDSVDVSEARCINISIGGMQIQGGDLRPQGTQVRFDLEIDDETNIRGLGEVIWMRTQDLGPGREAGMGVKFRFLEQRDRQVIFKLVSEHIKERLAQKHPPAEESPMPAAAEPAEPVISLPPDPEPSGMSFDRPAGMLPKPIFDEPEEESAISHELRFDADEPLEDPGVDEIPFDAPTEPETFADEPELTTDPVYRPRPKPRRSIPLLPILAFALVAGVVVVYFYRDAIFGPPEPPAGTVQAGSPEAGSPEAGSPGAASSEAPSPAATPPNGPPSGPAVKVERTPPPPASPPPPKAQPQARPFNRVTDISWERLPGSVVVTIETDGAISENRYNHFRLGGENPREVVRLKGVATRFGRGEILVEGSPISRIRIGYHANKELHVVLDLRDRGSRVTGIRNRGNALEVKVE